MKREDIYKELQKIVAPIHSHTEQLMAIASWFEQKLAEKTPKVFLVEYQCMESSVPYGTKFLVREDANFPHHYLISDGKPHVGGGTLLKKYCKMITA